MKFEILRICFSFSSEIKIFEGLKFLCWMPLEWISSNPKAKLATMRIISVSVKLSFFSFFSLMRFSKVPLLAVFGAMLLLSSSSWLKMKGWSIYEKIFFSFSKLISFLDDAGSLGLCYSKLSVNSDESCSLFTSSNIMVSKTSSFYSVC